MPLGRVLLFEGVLSLARIQRMIIMAMIVMMPSTNSIVLDSSAFDGATGVTGRSGEGPCCLCELLRSNMQDNNAKKRNNACKMK